MTSRGVSGFWLDIDKLEASRTHLIGELGPKEGMLVYGVWVRLFTWQYQSAAPITGPEHIKNLTGLHRNKAQLLWELLPQLLPRSLIRSPHGLLCKKTMQVLDKSNNKQVLTENQSAHSSRARVLDSDSDSDLREEKKEKIPPDGGAKGAPIGMWKVAENLLGNRALVGRLVKQYSEEKVMVAVARLASMRNPPDDPRGYVTQMLSKEPSKGGVTHGPQSWEMNT